MALLVWQNVVWFDNSAEDCRQNKQIKKQTYLSTVAFSHSFPLFYSAAPSRFACWKHWWEKGRGELETLYFKWFTIFWLKDTCEILWNINTRGAHTHPRSTMISFTSTIRWSRIKIKRERASERKKERKNAKATKRRIRHVKKREKNTNKLMLTHRKTYWYFT